MPWQKVDPVDERMRFILESQLKNVSFSELCRSFGVSRKTGYKWIERYESGGTDDLHERSRAPTFIPHKTPIEVEELIIKERHHRPTWGPKKIVKCLEWNDIKSPAPSTVGDILKRNGLIAPRKKRISPQTGNWPNGLRHPTHPNHVWGVDFKGWFRTGDGKKCHPLTISDLCSRYILCCEGLETQSLPGVMSAFFKVFEDNGLPENIRCDNGSPFGGAGLCGLTKLSVLWLRLGINVEFIRRGHPEDNGLHERMHKTLKYETAWPSCESISEQQKRFDIWREEFNTIRPHEALRMQPPQSIYERSPRVFNSEVPDFTYPLRYEARKVRSDGMIHWQGRMVFIGDGFAGSSLGLIENPEGEVDIWAGQRYLGKLRTPSGQP